MYQTNHAIRWNRSRDLFQRIAWFVWYTFTLCRGTLLSACYLPPTKYRVQKHSVRDFGHIIWIYLFFRRPHNPRHFIHKMYSVTPSGLSATIRAAITQKPTVSRHHYGVYTRSIHHSMIPRVTFKGSHLPRGVLGVWSPWRRIYWMDYIFYSSRHFESYSIWRKYFGCLTASLIRLMLSDVNHQVDIVLIVKTMLIF